jgi:hypothetical protein
MQRAAREAALHETGVLIRAGEVARRQGTWKFWRVNNARDRAVLRAVGEILDDPQ